MQNQNQPEGQQGQGQQGQQQQPEVQQQAAGGAKSLEEIQLQVLCNWCRNPLIMTENFSESNFVDVGRKWHADDTANAQAVYCGDCHNNQFMLSSPKAVIDRTTLDTCNIEDLPDLSAA